MIMNASTVPSELVLEQYIAPPPELVVLEVTMRCNLRCPMCFHGSTPHSVFAGKDMDLETVDLLGPVLRTAREVVLGGGGEPLVMPDLARFAEKCHRHNPDIDVVLISNGLLLTEQNARMTIEKQVHRIDFSMDGTIQYGHVGGGADYDRVRDNLRLLNRLKGDYGTEEPHIRIVFVAMRDNLCELPALIEFVQEVGAAVCVQPISPATEEQRNQNLFRHSSYARRALQDCIARARERGVALEVRNMDSDLSQKPRKCRAACESLWVSFDGSLSPCCGGISTGRNIHEADLSLEELWNGPDMRRLRWELETENYNDTCRSCSIRWNSIENQERSIPQESPAERITCLTEQNARLTTQITQLSEHLTAIRNGRVMRFLRTVDRLVGRAK